MMNPPFTLASFWPLNRFTRPYFLLLFSLLLPIFLFLRVVFSSLFADSSGVHAGGSREAHGWYGACGGAEVTWYGA
ncbi:hypothetical protein ES288_A09G122100v1 [Gossypium darwinii]|uniref:Uncharacterized protein n=2 Tax=Gossypium TaxID=3633 RepID=A0A5D2P2X7_GOSTO|nr:hypothetical protein ES288_A09G122100v1 [Gossypium darwinii]TYI10096.1 hypothetical protein ES332_A09G117800v1 [Gossypium tomentosum]